MSNAWRDTDRMPGHAPFALEEAVVIGYNVQRLRCDQAITKTMFANMANISRPTLNKVENGMATNIQLSRLRKIADALNVTILDLLTPPSNPTAGLPGATKGMSYSLASLPSSRSAR